MTEDGGIAKKSEGAGCSLPAASERYLYDPGVTTWAAYRVSSSAAITSWSRPRSNKQRCTERNGRRDEHNTQSDLADGSDGAEVIENVREDKWRTGGGGEGEGNPSRT